MYFITCMEQCKTHSEYGFFDSGNARCFGYYDNLRDAVAVLNENRCDLHETVYWYAVIEEIGQGISRMPTGEWWFKYDKDRDGFFEIEKPKETEHVCNHALG